MNKEEKRRLENAEQQFTGFITGSQGYSIDSFVESMNLEEWEWKHLQKEELINGLTEQNIREINEYFEELKQ